MQDPGACEDFLVKMAYLHPEPPSLAELKELTWQLLRMLCQKTAGQRGINGDIVWEGNYERVRMCLLNLGIRLARSGMLDSIDLDGPMPPAEIADKAKMKDRDRKEAEIRETFWGQEIDPEGLKWMVDTLESGGTSMIPEEYFRRMIILETVLIVLSGRLECTKTT